MTPAIRPESEQLRPLDRTSTLGSGAFDLASGSSAEIERVRKRMTNPFLLWMFLWAKVPAAAFAGVRLAELDPKRCRTTVPYGWRSTNPFRSIYFAAQAMAAELSTGALAMLAVESAAAKSGGSVALLITGLEASFDKKANALTTFTCEAGDELFAAVARAVGSGEAETVRAETIGRMPDGTEVSRFTFDWSFKLRG